MTFADYRAIRAMNWSTLKNGIKSMRHLHHALTTTDDGDTSSRQMLRLNHAAVLEPHTLDTDYVVFDGAVRRGKEWEAFKAAHPSAQIVKAEELARARRVADAVMSYAPARTLIESAQCEHTIQWTDPETGVACKGRLDVLGQGTYIADLKGDKSTDAFAFARRVGSLTYYGQAAWYQIGCEVLYGDVLPAYNIVYEVDEPHDVAVFRVDNDWIQPGRDLARRLLREYGECVNSGRWPGRYDSVQPLPSPPSYINPNVDDYAVEVIED